MDKNNEMVAEVNIKEINGETSIVFKENGQEKEIEDMTKAQLISFSNYLLKKEISQGKKIKRLTGRSLAFLMTAGILGAVCWFVPNLAAKIAILTSQVGLLATSIATDVKIRKEKKITKAMIKSSNEIYNMAINKRQNELEDSETSSSSNVISEDESENF